MREIRNYFELSEHENPTYKNATKEALRRKCFTFNSYIKHKEDIKKTLKRHKKTLKTNKYIIIYYKHLYTHKV